MKRLILTRDSEEGIAELLGVIEQWHKRGIEDLQTVRDSKDVKTITMQSVSGETIQVEADSELGLGVRVGIQAAINLFQELPFKVELLPGEDSEAPVVASPADEEVALLRECRLALDELIRQKPGIEALMCGSTTLGNLRAELGKHK